MLKPLTVKISGRATPKALIDILRPSFFEIALKGLKTFNRRKILMIFKLLEFYSLRIN